MLIQTSEMHHSKDKQVSIFSFCVHYPPPALSSSLPGGLGLPVSSRCAHCFTYWLILNPVIIFQFLFCIWLAFFFFFFMLPSCGLPSVNLLMKMSANDSNHLNRFEKCLYSHCFLSGCCLLSLQVLEKYQDFNTAFL